MKPCHKGNTNEPEVLREGEGEAAVGGNGLHMDLKEHRHHSYVVHLMKQNNPGARLPLLLLLLLLYHTAFTLISLFSFVTVLCTLLQKVGQLIYYKTVIHFEEGKASPCLSFCRWCKCKNNMKLLWGCQHYKTTTTKKPYILCLC